jgi:hypothetical protein
MLTIRGTYDGKTFKPLPTESLPRTDREVPVAIIFLEDISLEDQIRQYQIEVAKRMRAARDAMPPLGISVKDLVEQGRER